MTAGMDPNQLEPPANVTTTIELLERFKQGDATAVDQLVERSLPPLKRWARGRLPVWARSLADTQDLVQDAVVRALPHLSTSEGRQPGAPQAYLRQAIPNHIRAEIRKVQSKPMGPPLGDSFPDVAPSPLEHAIGRERLERYETALARLRPEEREAIVARLELQQSYEEVALALGKSTPDAARMAVARAVRNLVQAMTEPPPVRDPAPDPPGRLDSLDS